MPFDHSAITSPFRMLPGLSRLAPGQPQLTPNRPSDAALAAKLAVLRRHPWQALVRSPGWDEAPALATLSGQARLEHPLAWSETTEKSGTHVSTARLLGWSIAGDGVDGDGPPQIGECLRALPTEWRRAALLSLAFAEDLAVIDAASGRIPWLAVCLPSHWAPESKLGKTFAEVHAPVADNQALLRSANALTRLVTGPRRWQRFVWTLTPSGCLDGHPLRWPAPRWPGDADAATIGELAWLRSEHQTFLPVPGRGQAVFTIHVELRRLAEVAADPLEGRATCDALHAALRTMSSAVLDYRRLTDARERLLEWLAAHGGDGVAS